MLCIDWVLMIFGAVHKPSLSAFAAWLTSPVGLVAILCVTVGAVSLAQKQRSKQCGPSAEETNRTMQQGATEIAQPRRIYVVSVLYIICGVVLISTAFSRLSRDLYVGGAAALLQSFVLFGSGFTLWKRHRDAVLLLRVNAILFTIAAIVHSLMVADLVLIVFIWTFYFWYRDWYKSVTNRPANDCTGGPEAELEEVQPNACSAANGPDQIGSVSTERPEEKATPSQGIPTPSGCGIGTSDERPGVTWTLKTIGRSMPLWVRLPLLAMIALTILIVVLAMSISTETISTQAFVLDRTHHYGMGGILRTLACARGEGKSCDKLADMYENGKGVPKDIPRAFALYSRAAELYLPACDLGMLKICGALAELYEDGKGVEKDASRAAELYRREAWNEAQACDAGNGKVCGELGLSYSVGHAVPHNCVEQNDIKAAEFYTKACNLGEAYDGCLRLGNEYQFGRGVPHSYEQASVFYIKACDLGEPSGCREAGGLYDWAAFGAPNDFARAAGLYARACNSGDDLGCNFLGDLYRDGKGVPQDLEKAKYYYSKACSSPTDLHFGCEELTKLR